MTTAQAAAHVALYALTWGGWAAVFSVAIGARIRQKRRTEQPTELGTRLDVQL